MFPIPTPSGSVIVSGRSDSTLNRNGVRLGSADIYTVVDKLPRLSESLVIGAELGEGAYWLALFVVLAPGAVLDEELKRMEEMVSSNQLIEVTAIRPILDQIIADPAVINVSRARAQRLLEQAAH